jgi:polyphenol oxidase
MMPDVGRSGATAATRGTTPPPVPGDFEWVDRSWGPTLVSQRLRSFDHGWTTRALEVPRGDEGTGPGWQQLAAAADVEIEGIIRLRQVHSARVIEAAGPLQALQEADAVVTRDHRVLLTVRVADCVPLLIGDPITGAAAAVHAGWRGTSAGIAVRAVERLRRVFRSDPRNLVAAIGPSIGPCCYAIGPELRHRFLESGWPESSVTQWFQDGPERRLDLWRANRDQLTGAGVPAGSVALSGLCTACHPAWFHSYRRDRERAGRLIGFIKAAKL